MIKNVYFKPNLVIEPLIGKWCVWPYLISPASTSYNIIKRHIEIINSYIEMPEVHVEAVKKTKILGGSFVECKISHKDDQSRRFAGSDCEKGMSLVDIFQSLEVYVFAMGKKTWCEFTSSIKYIDEFNPIVQSNRLITECLNRKIKIKRLYDKEEISYNKIGFNYRISKNTF